MKQTLLRRRPADSAGFTLMSVLVAMFIFWIGMIAVARTMVGVTSSATQAENVSSMATISNAFWGVVQSEPAMLNTATFTAQTAQSFTAATITNAPPALQPWLTTTTTALPAATVTILASPDAASGAVCSSTGCTVKMTLSWLQVGTPGQSSTTRSQDFYYQFGL